VRETILYKNGGISALNVKPRLEHTLRQKIAVDTSEISNASEEVRSALLAFCARGCS
jgi:hypothetical protein